MSVRLESLPANSQYNENIQYQLYIVSKWS